MQLDIEPFLRWVVVATTPAHTEAHYSVRYETALELRDAARACYPDAIITIGAIHSREVPQCTPPR